MGRGIATDLCFHIALNALFPGGMCGTMNSGNSDSREIAYVCAHVYYIGSTV